jgi:putative heme-binding domain-containing protein
MNRFPAQRAAAPGRAAVGRRFAAAAALGACLLAGGGLLLAQAAPKKSAGPSTRPAAAAAKPAGVKAPPKPKANNAAQATPVDKLTVAKGFKVELLHTVPAETEGSWVSMCVDGKGRLIVCDQYGGLFRVTPPPVATGKAEAGGAVAAAGAAAAGDASGLQIEKIPAKVGAANGLLWAFDALYVVVNDYEKSANNGVYRVTASSPGSDVLDKVELLRAIPGAGSDHGPHAALLAPDGKSIYIVVGNKSDPVPTETSSVVRHVGEDHLLPRMPDGRGFMRDKLAPGGNIYRMSPDGKTWDMFATGFRNEYDAAFNKDGELFTYDADMEYDFNTPWYRPTRINHVVSGGEYGWRNGAGKWPAWYEDSLGAVLDIGPGSPTGVTFGYGAKFPAKYQNALFANDWSWGRLYAVHMKPAGASYVAEREEFVTGSPLPLTDIVVRPQDGAMYFAIGGRKAQSGLYRVTYVGDESTAPAEPTRGTPADVAARELRHKLESYHDESVKLTDVEVTSAVLGVWQHLGSDDRSIRYAARTALEHLPLAQWKAQALAEAEPGRLIPALLALVRVTSIDPPHRKPTNPPEDKALQAQVVDAVRKLDLNKLTDWQRLALLRLYQVCFTRMGMPAPAQVAAVTSQLSPHFPSKSVPVSYDLCMVLSYLQDPSLAAKAVPLLASAPSQEEQMEYARSLRMLKAGWTPELRTKQFEWFLRAANYRGGASFTAFINMIRTDAEASLTDAEKTTLKPILEKKPEKTSPLAAISMSLQGRERKAWTVDQLAPVAEKKMAGRDFDRGRQMFGAVGCFACHRFGTEGGMVGPDLTAVGARYGVRDLLYSIIEPSKDVSDQFAPSVVKTLDGDQVIGRIVNLNGDRVMVNTDLFDPNQQTSVDRNQVKSIETSKQSLMPEGLLDYLKEDEVLDLLAYLVARGDATNAVFKK